MLGQTALLMLSLIGSTLGESSCQHPEAPKLSNCEGCPPMFDGKPCASTTWYNDLTKGACGCGDEPNPPDFWTKSKYTAAGNAMMMDPGDPTNSWCTSNCGLCFELCTTGGTINGEPSTPAECIVIQLENREGSSLPECLNNFHKDHINK